jgi:hypothetical protein
MKLYLLLLLPFALLYSDTINIKKASLRGSYENVKISDTEDMGLAGLEFLFEANDNFYYGLGAYGAVDGNRGGFFVGGFTGGFKYNLFDNVYLDTGVFVGGGGGGNDAGQGGGLMLRSYAGGFYDFNDYTLGVNYSYIKFPNGTIDSSQVSLVGAMKFDTVFVDGPVSKDILRRYHVTSNEDYVVATYQTYFPKEGTLTRGKTPLTNDINLLGIEYGANVSKNVIAYFESAGAMSGAPGYMEVLGGMGYTQSLTKSSNVQAKLSVGAAGGGHVDTEGGGITKASVNLNYNPTKTVNTGIGAGYIHAFNGGFDAPFAKISLGINTNFLSVGGSKKELDYNSVSSQKLNIRICNQTYLYSDTLTLNPNNTDNVDQIGLKLDWFVTNNLYLTGQGLAAYSGGAGGYAVGMFGTGYIQPLFYDFYAVAEVAFGGAGGGGIDVGGGNIVQPMGGLLYQISKKVAFEALYGKVVSINGNLDADVLEFGLVYKFSKLILN